VPEVSTACSVLFEHQAALAVHFDHALLDWAQLGTAALLSLS